jgi:acyl-CoA synthetase (NDP forming)
VSELWRVRRPIDRHVSADSERAHKIVAEARAAGQGALTFAQGADLLAAYHIPVCPFFYVTDDGAAGEFAAKVGYPLVAKIDALKLFHRFEHGAVITGIRDEGELHAALEKLRQVIEEEELADGRILLQPMIEGRELIMGVNRDPSFGPVIMFGIGGTFVEALKDVSFGVAPLSIEHAQLMIRSIRAFPLLGEFRGQSAVDISRLATILHRLSRLSMDIPEIVEIDLNPFMAGRHLSAVDILIKL